jgi:LPXTG-site transpeptidase (sortase) family protein
VGLIVPTRCNASRRGWALTIGALTLASAVLSGCGGAPAAVDTAVGAPSTPAPTPAPAAVRLTPESIRIPTIAVAAPVGLLGFDDAKQTVEVPTKPMDAGWYRYGSTPGEDGSAVILGHVDSNTGPAVFARLKELRRGDQVAVTMSDRSVINYRVDEIATYPNAKFPAHRVYRTTGPTTLNLVTCGGAYDRAEGGYQSNVVVYTSRLGPGTG